MPGLDLPDPKLVTSPEALEKLVRAVAREPILAVDTESNSLYAYRERVCLIQFSTPKVDYLVDPLALGDLSPLAPIFADAHIEKVFHAAEYDVICLERDFGFKFTNLFDTMLASRILGKREVGLGSILRDGFGVYLNKRHQRANWGQRPLPAHLLDYARLDTHFLIPLRHRLRAELKSNHLWPLAEEDFRRLCSVNERLNGNGEGRVGCWRVSGAQDLDPQQAAVLRELCRYREQVARTIDRPLFKVIGDKTLLAIAGNLPKGRGSAGEVAGDEPQAGEVPRQGDSPGGAARFASGTDLPAAAPTTRREVPVAVGGSAHVAQVHGAGNWGGL